MDRYEDRMMEIRASPAKKQKHQLNSHDEERRSYAAVVRASLFSAANDLESHDDASSSQKKSETSSSSRTVIVVEAGGGCRPRTTPTLTSRHSQIRRQQQPLQPQSFDVQPFLRQLDDCIEMEAKYRGSVQPSSAQVSPVSPGIVESATITSGMRDGSAHVLRCLKVWYDLPSDVFFNAISSIDRFLSKMKVSLKAITSALLVSNFELELHLRHWLSNQ